MYDVTAVVNGVQIKGVCMCGSLRLSVLTRIYATLTLFLADARLWGLNPGLSILTTQPRLSSSHTTSSCAVHDSARQEWEENKR